MRIKQRNDKLSDSVKLPSRVVVDTNVLIRALIDDNDDLSKIVANTEVVHIPLPIFFETAFVLEKLYKQPREIIIDYISTISSYDNILTDKEGLREILDIYSRKHNLSIIDCFLIAYADMNNLEIRTLDKALKRY